MLQTASTSSTNDFAFWTSLESLRTFSIKLFYDCAHNFQYVDVLNYNSGLSKFFMQFNAKQLFPQTIYVGLAYKLLEYSSRNVL